VADACMCVGTGFLPYMTTDNFDYTITSVQVGLSDTFSVVYWQLFADRPCFNP